MMVCFVPLLFSCQENKTSFDDFDLNKDGLLSGEELSSFNADFIDSVDRNEDWSLSKREFKGYTNFEKRMNVEKAFIPKTAKVFTDVAYVDNGHITQKLDIYLPKNYKSNTPLPLVIWVHGGGWKKLTKEDFGRQTILLKHGFAVASINYRLTRYATFPAQIYDTKAAIRFLRKHAADYNLNPDKFGLWGSSAGGHLVSLAGVADDDSELEGAIGVTDVSSKVQAVCSWFGVSDMVKIVEDLNIQNGTKEVPNITKLLGGNIDEKLALANLSSPINHITSDDPPFLLMHGDIDKLVPVNQSILFDKKLKEAGVESELIILKDAKHSFFKEEKELNKVVDFFKSTLK